MKIIGLIDVETVTDPEVVGLRFVLHVIVFFEGETVTVVGN